MNRVRRALGENGLYSFGNQVIEFLLGAVRNALIARKLGVRTIKIGPRAYLRGLTSLDMGEDFSAGDGLWLEAVTRYNDQTFVPRIVIGKHVRASHFVHIAATNRVEIGDNVLLGSKVMISDHNHGQYSKEHTSPHLAPTLRPLDHDRQVIIGRNVWLADGVVVTPGSIIGEGSVIGANSVVMGSIPPFAIASGIPATVRKCFDFNTAKWSNVE
ncbi:MAG: DapH/DapD/GlmU-related protein [Terracidiphilus sp.]|nr:DapH/DapD/GlmU-related protein [Terracidiphilus sp.]